MSDHSDVIAVLGGWAAPWSVGVGASAVDRGDGPPLVRARAAAARSLSIAGAAIGHHALEPVRRNPGSGRPEWTEGVVGAVSHDHALAVAVLGRRIDVLGLGVDVERVGGLAARDARDAVLCEGEQWGEIDDRDPTVRFAAKEAAFKAFAGAREATPPGDVTTIAVTLDAGRFRSVLGPHHVEGRWAVIDSTIVAFAVIPARSAPRTPQ